MPVSIDDLRRTIEFRQRLVAYMSSVLEHGSRRYGAPMDDDARSSLAAEKVWLAQEYGRLFAVINRWGGMGLGSQAFGLSSRDAVSDAIHNVGDGFYGDLARVAQQHLDTVIGRLRAELEGRSSTRTPELIYRLTSPVYWLKLIVSAVAWLWGSNRRRIAAIVGALLLTVIGAFVSGVAQAVAQQWLARP